MSAPSGVCDTCGETFKLVDGKMPRHKSPWNTRHVCKGSSREPEPPPEPFAPAHAYGSGSKRTLSDFNFGKRRAARRGR